MQQSIDFANIEIRKLRETDAVENFDCGDKDLNDFILTEASDYRKALLAVSYIVVEHKNPQNVLGFFSVANDKVSLGDFSDKTEFNRFRKKQGFPQPKRLKSYPAVKLCRLGIDLKYRKNHIGSFILDFLRGLFTHDNKSGCRFMTVDAYINAVPFYEKRGFKLLEPSGDTNPHTRLMFCDLNDSNYVA